MRRTTIILSAAALLLGAAEASAQAKPSFAGKWTRVVDPAAPPPTGRGGGGGLGGLGMEATIAQDEKTLTITRATQAGETKSVYNLDGSESKNALAMGARAGGGAATETVSKARWDANKLIITTSINFNGNAFETSMTMSLDAAGALTIESTSPGRGGAAPTSTKSTYKKG